MVGLLLKVPYRRVTYRELPAQINKPHISDDVAGSHAYDCSDVALIMDLDSNWNQYIKYALQSPVKQTFSYLSVL
jgi:hypothetical protein